MAWSRSSTRLGSDLSRTKSALTASPNSTDHCFPELICIRQCWLDLSACPLTAMRHRAAPLFVNWRSNNTCHHFTPETHITEPRAHLSSAKGRDLLSMSEICGGQPAVRRVRLSSPWRTSRCESLQGSVWGSCVGSTEARKSLLPRPPMHRYVSKEGLANLAGYRYHGTRSASDRALLSSIFRYRQLHPRTPLPQRLLELGRTF